MSQRSEWNETLTKREAEIARAYADGQNYRLIADQLCIAPSTVRKHISTIYRKLGVKTKIELLRRLEPPAIATAPRKRKTRDPAVGLAVISVTALVFSVAALTATALMLADRPSVAVAGEPPLLEPRPAGPQ